MTNLQVPGDKLRDLAVDRWTISGGLYVGYSSTCIQVGNQLLGPAAARELAAVILAATEEHERVTVR